MVHICPTVTASDPEQYKQQMQLISELSSRLHIDFADGDFAPTHLLPINQAWLPEGYEVDIHLMYRTPAEEIETVLAMHPDLVILHAESEGNILGLLREINGSGVRSGVALLQNTQPEDFANEIEEAEHALIFGGKLGYHGGDADLTMLNKIERIKEINPLIEIGWDGGANDKNFAQLVNAGVSVVNVGGFIHKSDDPKTAYAILESMTK
jgi:ribulose-phosphate 3-epimerase